MSENNCDYCDESFESEEELHLHWLENHEDELNSHEKDDAKKAKRKKEEAEKQARERRKNYLFQGVGVSVLLVLAAVLGPQLVDSIVPSDSNANISLDNQPVLGSENASVTVVEFGDFECPACASFESSAVQQLKSEYIDSGQVNFVWKDYPLEQIHPWSRTAAETMECVYREDNDAFWNVKEQLFRNQGTLNEGNAQDQIIEWAVNEGLDTEAVKSCTGSSEVSETVNRDMNEGRSNDVTGTPTVFVNGQKVDSSYQAIQQAIEEELE